MKNSVSPILNMRKFKAGIKNYIQYRRDWVSYSRMANSEALKWDDAYPCLYDRLPSSPFGPHYFYQGFWAFRKIMKNGPASHVDIGSEIRWVGLLSAITQVTFVDIRPFETDLDNLIVKKGDILDLPFPNDSIESLSCLHVAEHIGLGRYGDELNPEGTKLACAELQRVVSVNGNLFFSVPIGKQKTYFNAHRVHSLRTIVGYFPKLKLIEISAVTDSGHLEEDVDINSLENSKYACGLFVFRKEKQIEDNEA